MKYFFSFFIIISITKASFSALLLNVESDYLFHFSYKNNAFYCRPAAIITINQLLFYPKLSKVCHKKVINLIKRYPYMNKQYKYKLYEQQKYFIKGLKDDCFVMLNAGVSFSQHLLKFGFAKLKISLDKKFLSSTLYKTLKRTQDSARYHKRGIWEDLNLIECFKPF